MAEIEKYLMEHELGCGFFGAIFQHKRKSPAISAGKPPMHDSRRPRTATATPRSSTSKTPKPSDASRSSTSTSSSSSNSGQSKAPSKKLTEKKMTGDGDTKQSNDKALIKPNSSNITPLKRLANLNQSKIDNLQDGSPRFTPRMGNIIARHSNGEIPPCRGLDPEALKKLGNDFYKQGKFNEALVLYDRAIALDSRKPTYRSNRSAALIGLGRLVEAIDECTEAIKLDPTYHRAHHRLAALYLRLGEADEALYHYKNSGSYANSKEIIQARALRKHLNQCIKARKLQDWKTLLMETHFATSSGADSAPQIYALQAEALLKLNKHQEANTSYQKGQNFSIESCINIFGLAVSAFLFIVTTQVCISAGRFEEAIAAAQHAANLDPSNKEVHVIVNKARTVASARLSGNSLYKASKFSEACIVYNEGLELDPYNSVLLCNRAACRYKLGQFEKAIEDCNTALNVQPSYSKARLRRADCYTKIERWEAAIEDYETLVIETPGDKEVGRALFEVKVELKKARGEDIENTKLGSNLVSVNSNEQFRQFVASAGMSVVLFCNEEKQSTVLEQICKRFPSVSFLKVEVEEHAMKSEGVKCIPCFKIYKKGSKIKEIPGNDRDLLEKSIQLYSN